MPLHAPASLDAPSLERPLRRNLFGRSTQRRPETSSSDETTQLTSRQSTQKHPTTRNDTDILIRDQYGNTGAEMHLLFVPEDPEGASPVRLPTTYDGQHDAVGSDDFQDAQDIIDYHTAMDLPETHATSAIRTFDAIRAARAKRASMDETFPSLDSDIEPLSRMGLDQDNELDWKMLRLLYEQRVKGAAWNGARSRRGVRRGVVPEDRTMVASNLDLGELKNMISAKLEEVLAEGEEESWMFECVDE